MYLDYAATAPLRPEAKAAMEPWLGPAANCSSLHASGRAARDAVDLARSAIARQLGVEFGSVLFCSGGTEAAAIVLLGAAGEAAPGRSRILLSATEHECVTKQTRFLVKLGCSVETVPSDRNGRMDVDALQGSLGDDVLLVAAMEAQNEVGSCNDLVEIGRHCAKHGALLAVDAVQTFPHCEEALSAGADLLFASGHKFGGPQGAGIVYVRPGVRLAPVMAGGGQERGTRAGTENVAAIVGAAAAACQKPSGLAPMRQELSDHLVKLAGFHETDTGADRLPGLLHGRFPGVRAETLLVRLDRAGIEASAGSACSSGSLEPSRALSAMGWDEESSREAVRFSLGYATTRDEVRSAAEGIVTEVQAVRSVRG
ncbi:MAG: cysteine desulfurase family protein [Fimbriimonadaceae bacterium]